MAKMTAAERKAAREAEAEQARQERRSQELRKFYAAFLRGAQRRTYTQEALFADENRGEADRGGWALYRQIDELRRLRTQLKRELASMAREANEAAERLAANRAPFWSSNGIGARYYEVDKYGHQIEVLQKAIADLADATGWRVREIEDAETSAHYDKVTPLRVVSGGVGRWHVVDITTGVPVDGTPAYESEDAAIASLYVIVNGRSI